MPTKDSIKPHIEKIKKYANKETVNKVSAHSLFYKNKTENFFKENSVWITIGIIVMVSLFSIVYLFFSPEKNKLTSFKNIIIIATTVFGLPFLVWNYKNAHEQKETARKSLQETQNNNRRTQENKIYMDCVGHLSNVQETIRTASIHGFGELLGNLENEIKNSSETDIRKQERINFQDKILNVLWSFMVEHSREVLKQKAKDENSQEYKDAKEKINSLYHPQFRFIMELLAKYRPYKYTLNNFWKNKYWINIYLQGIDLSHAELSGANLCVIDLNEAFLPWADLSEAYLCGANLSWACLIEADLRGASLYKADLNRGKYNNATKFPDGFDPAHHNMIYRDKPTQQVKQAEKSLESAE